MLSDGASVYLVGHETLGQWDGADWTFYLPDALGSVRQTTDDAGTVLDAREWTPFGVEVGAAQEGLGYTGEWWDDGAEFLYLRARWYDGAVGRFTLGDPFSGFWSKPQTLNRFVYVEGNSINRTDPSGLYGEEVHFELTKELAYCIAVGGTYDCPEQGPCWPNCRLGNFYAGEIAKADQYVDDPKSGMHPFPGGQPRQRHFATREEAERAIHQAIEKTERFEVYDEQAAAVLREFGYALHMIQDSYSHWGEGYVYGKDYEEQDMPPVVMGQLGHAGHTVIAKSKVLRWNDPVLWFSVSNWRKELKETYPEAGSLIDELSADDVVDLWIREQGVTETGKKLRNRYGYDTDKYVEFSERDRQMKEATRAAILMFFDAFGCPGPNICH